jgi:hypothetical protein
MDELVNTFDLSAEQQHTAALLYRLLGKAIADRYVDFCRLAAGRFGLRVSRPLAAHVLRELDSMLRHVLAVPMEAKAEQQGDPERLEEAKQSLTALGFSDAAILDAVKTLKPRLNHKSQIEKIASRLGFDRDSDIAKSWVSLCKSFGKAHERSFHHSLKVDEEFRARYQQPFETVIRAIALALQNRYAALMRRVEDLAAMPDRGQAVKLFESEIPGALPLQRHFFQALKTGDWLPHLVKEALLDEPYAHPAGGTETIRFREWPCGEYLQRMAQSTDTATRKAVSEALRNVASSQHPDVQYAGIEILAALPPEDSAALVDIACGWLRRDTNRFVPRAAHTLLKSLVDGRQEEAALRLARCMLQLWDRDGQIVSLYTRRMYEHYLPAIVEDLTKCCGEQAFRLFAELFHQAGAISGKSHYSYYTSLPVADDEKPKLNIYDALQSAVRGSAELLIQRGAAPMRTIIGILRGYPDKIFVRIALHVLAQNPSAAPDLAEDYLLTSEFIEQTWCQHEYAALALAWFPSLTPEKQRRVLAIIDSIPDTYLEAWKVRFEDHQKSPPNTEDERIFRAATFRNLLWKWRSVLPPDRQASLDTIVQELGEPDAWRERLLNPEGDMSDDPDFSGLQIEEIVAHLRGWQPIEPQHETATALAHKLQAAAATNPLTYADNADRFVGLRPIFVRYLLEGLLSAVRNKIQFEWRRLLTLIEFTFGQFKGEKDPATVSDGDDDEWSWACLTASKLLSAGLERGEAGIDFDNALQVRTLISNLIKLVPRQPALVNSDKPYFDAIGTLRGLAVQLAVLSMCWLSKDATPSGFSPRDTLGRLPDTREFLEAELADRSTSGRIPRAIMGRYLSHLFYFGEEWLQAHLDALFPASDEALRRAAWLSHLGHFDKDHAREAKGRETGLLSGARGG